MNFQEPLHAAVMLEQASYCFVLTKPAMLHKYGFHLVLSGDHYKICDQVHATLLKGLSFVHAWHSKEYTLFAFSRLTMQFVHIEVRSLFMNQLLGAISKTMFTFILDSKF